MELTLFTQIEESVLREIDKIICKNRKDLSKFSAARSDNNVAQRPKIHVAITGGDISKVTMSHGRMSILIEILVVSTNQHTEWERRDDLYPVIIALVKWLSGRVLKNEKGETFPIDNIYPTGKWGQVSKQGEQMAYVINFGSVFNFNLFQEDDAQEIRGFFLDYYIDESLSASDELEILKTKEGHNAQRRKNGKRIRINGGA
jgi:hypothetical protein